jgi:hypothetical protein
MQSFNHACLILLSMFILTACDSSDAEEGDDDSSSDSDTGDLEPGVLYNRCAQEDRLGGFEATVLDEYSGIQGAVANGVVPASITSNEMEQGGCTLWKTHILICDPPCTAEETCDFDGTCVPFPLNQDVGTVTVDGLDKDIAMEPREPGNNYFDADVPHPIFDSNNQVVEMKTTAGYLNEITLKGAGSNAIKPQADAWIVTPGEDFTVSWDAPPSDTRAAVVLRLSVDQHGSTPTVLECVFEDTGEGMVPSAVIDGLIGAGVTGYPNAGLTRGTVDSVQVAQGCVEFAVKSYLSVDVSVSGYIPCTGPGTCPEGMTCNLETFLCEED